MLLLLSRIDASLSRSFLLRTPRSRSVFWNSSSSQEQKDQRSQRTLKDNFRESKRFACRAVICPPSEDRRLFIRLRWSFCLLHSFICSLADRFGTDASRSTRVLSVKSSSMASTSGKALWAERRVRSVTV